MLATLIGLVAAMIFSFVTYMIYGLEGVSWSASWTPYGAVCPARSASACTANFSPTSRAAAAST